MTWDDAAKRMVANPEGIAFYHALIDELRANNIAPLATLYHWDLPLALHTELSPPGWLNREIVDHFVEYAELAFREFGVKVPIWSTFNEPWTFATAGYGTGAHAPGLKRSGTNTYMVAHHVLLSHGAAVRRFREIKGQEAGVVLSSARIGIVLNADFGYPLNASDPVDVEASHRKMHFGLGWFLEPIVSGEYPQVMRERAGNRLPRFTPDEAALVRGSYDLFMLNHYSSKVVTDCSSPLSHVNCHKQALGWERDLGVDETRMPPGSRPSSKDHAGRYNCNWFTGYPPGYLDTIRWMHLHDPSAEILLTENGWCGNDEIDNMDQLWYFQSYIEQVYKAITEEGIPIIGYTAWSFLDNYEWGSFKPRFGLYYVDDPATDKESTKAVKAGGGLARIPRPAATWYAQVAKSKCLDDTPMTAVRPKTIASDRQLEDDWLLLPMRNQAQLHVSRWLLRSSAAATGSMLAVFLVALAAGTALVALAWRWRQRQRRRRRLPYPRCADNLSTGETTPLLLVQEERAPSP